MLVDGTLARPRRLGAIITGVGRIDPCVEPIAAGWGHTERKGDREIHAWSPVTQKQNMRASLSSLLLSAAWLAGAGCASAPKEEQPVASTERACADAGSDPLHMVSSRPDAGRDPQIESILTQTADPRLAWVNRQMYQSLHALDVELRREQRIAECEHPQSSASTLEAQTNSGAGAGVGAAGTVAGTASTGMGTGATGGSGSAGFSVASSGGASAGTTSASGGTVAMAGGIAASQASGAVSSDAAPVAARSTLIRKTSLSATGGGGNGATAQKVTAGSDNDIVARRLRKAAEQETNPALRAKLWKEYADYRQATSVK